MKTAIIFGRNDSNIQKKAIEHISSVLVEQTMEYPSCYCYPDIPESDEYYRIFIGTKDDNLYIKEHSGMSLSNPEEYGISVSDRDVFIEGFDDAGVLYGCVDFYNKFIVKFENTDTHPNMFRKLFDGDRLPDFHLVSCPSVQNRGIWTWGNVIYDYKSFINNMIQLKFNRITIWNDFVPVNAREMIDYAHSCNIKVIWGFSWLWDTNCSHVNFDNLDVSAGEILNKFRREYAELGVDGIYFQSFTELHTEKIGEVLIAEAVTEFVNKTASMFFEAFGDIELQFGIHATSVREKLEYIKNTDSRIRLCWEDLGSFPFAYEASNIRDFEDTKNLLSKLTVLREKEKFGAVTKGFVCLDWNEFEHLPGSFYMGKCSKATVWDRTARKRKYWRYSQAHWISNADVAYDMIKQMANSFQGDLYISALVEDGMLESSIMYPVALYSEMLWDTERDIKELQSSIALRNYVEFA